MASTEAQTNGVTETRPPIIPNPPPSTNAVNTQLPTAEGSQHQATNTNQFHNGNAPAQQTPDNPQVQRDENHGDPSDGLWSIYLTEAEKQDSEVTESWKGDTDGILVFTGLFSATVAGFIVESYKKLSPDSSDTTNALLAQISVQLVNISNGIPLAGAGIAAESRQSFKPTSSAVRVNVLWFLSLVLSMNCALSATLMQQWARRYQELAQRRGAFHRRGRMRAYIFDGISRFGMARAIATMPTLLHTSVFLFFAGLVEFLFPIYTPVAYTTLGCIVVFALAYGVLTILPNIYLNCPYATPLSGFAWGISQFSAIGYLWTVLKFECRFPILWGLASRHAPEPDVLKRWRETIENQVKTRRQWFSQGMRKSVELCAYTADSTVVTSALEWTLTALDEDKEIEDFAARVPGFFDSRVVPDATLAVLPLMSHRPNADPIFGSRLYDLLQTCISETSTLDDKTRKNRLWVCMKCLWHFGKEYNKLGSSQPLPSYFPDALASPGITRRIQAEEDPGVRMMGRYFGALIVNKLAADLESRTDSIDDGKLACLSTILGTGRRDVESLLYQPGAVALLNTISLTFDKSGSLATGTGPSDVLEVVQQTLDILSQALSSQGIVRLDQPKIAIIDGSDGKFERILVSRLLDLLNTCTQAISPLPEDVRTSCLRVCLKGLWYFVRAFNQLGSSVPLPSDICIAFANPKIAISIGKSNDLVAHEIGRCVGALVVNKLAADVHSRADPIRDVELQCISAVLGGKSSDVILLLREPGAIELTNTFFLALPNIDTSASAGVPSDVLDTVQQTFVVLSKVLPAELNTAMQANTPMNVSDGASSLTAEMYLSVLRAWMKNLWHFTREYNERGNSTPLPSSIRIAFTNPEMTCRLRKQHDLAVRVIGRCVETLVVNKLAADIKSRRVPVKDDELACLSTILGTKSDDVVLLLSHPGAIEFTNMVFLALDDFDTASAKVPLYVLDVVQQTSSALSLDLPLELNAKMRLNQANILLNVSDGTSSLAVGVYTSVLRIWMKNLWHFTRGYNERGNSLPLPSYVYIAFTNPEMTRRICEERDLAVHVIGRCVEALVINKLAADINSREFPVSNDELACLSVILGTKSRDVTLLLSCPCAIEFTNMVFLALDDFDSSTPGTVPPYVLDVFQQTSSALSRALPPELNSKMRLNQTDTLMDVPDGTSLTAEIHMSILRGWMKNLWHFARECNEYGSSVPLPSYISIAFTNPEMTHRIREERDLAVHVMGRCVRVLVVNKLTADISSRVLVGNDELACLSAILGTKSDKVIHLLSHPGAIAFTNMVFFALDDFDSASTRVPLYVLDAVQQTSSALYQDLPPELNAKMRLDILLNVPDGTSSLTAEMYTSILRGWVKNLWHFTREYNQCGSSVPLPSYVSIAFANPELSRRIREQRGLAVRVMGRCVEVLVVNKLAADIRSRNVLICNDDLACLSAILGTKSDDVMLLLSHPGAIAFTNMVFLTLGNLYSFTLGTVPSYVRDLVQQTSSTLSQALPPELSAKMRLNQTNTLMYASNGTSSLTAEMYRRVLNMWMKNLWHFTRDYNRRANSVPLPSYVSIAFTNQEMTHRILGERDPAVRMIGRCIEVLVVNKLATEIKSRNDSDQLACVSTILGTKSDDVMLLLSHPGAIEFTNMIFLALDDIDSSAPGTVPIDMLDVIQQTSSALSKALPPEMSTKMRLNQAITLIDVSDGITAEMYLTILRVWMKNLWDFTRGYNERGNSVPLPSYISVSFTNPEMTCRIRKQRDLAVRMVARCVGALVVNKLAADIKSRNVPVSNVELACISAILGTERDDVLRLLRHPGAIELTNIVFFAWANIDTPASTSVPSDALDVIRQTFGILSRALPTELNIVMRLDQTGASIGISNGTTSFTAEIYLTVLRVWMKDLWDFTRGYNESGDSVPLPAYVRIAFTNPELTRCIREQRDLAVRVIGRCIGALVVNKLATDIKSRGIPVTGTDDELACLSAILVTRSDEVIRLLSHPGAIEFTNMIFFALDNFDSFTLGTVSPYVLDIVQRTSGALSRTLPPELNAKIRPSGKNTPMNVSDATSSLTLETYMSVLRERMKNLWHFTREYNERGNSVPLPSYAFVAFGNPELTRRICKQRDPAVHVIGRCVEALVVNKLVTDIKSRDIPVTNDELACLSAILGTKNDDVILLLSHPGAIEFTNMVFLTLDDFDSTFGTVPSYALDVVQQTSSALSHDLPPELKPMMRLRQTNTLMNASDGSSSLTGNIYTNILRGWMKNLCHLTREYNECGNSLPLPTYVSIVFTNPEMTRRICEQRELALCVIGRCAEALVVAKLAADIESRDVPVSNDELGCLLAILCTESHDVGLCLSQPGTIQLVNLASLALGVVSSLEVDQMPPDTRYVLQQTLAVLSQTIPVRANAELPLDQTVAPVDISDDNFEHTILFHIHDLLRMFIPGASSLVEEVRTSCLRMCLKALWHCAKAYHQTSDPLPSSVPLVLAAPEVTRLFQTEQDLVARITGSCFGALIVDKLMDALESPLSSSGRVRNAEMACISAILGTEHGEVLLLPHQLRVINLWNVVSLMSGEADTLSTAAGLPVDVLKLVQDTLHILVNRLRDRLFVSGRLPIDQWRLLQKKYSDVVNALGSDQLRNETVKTLNQLRQLLEKLLPGVEESQDTAIPSLITNH